jgi:hypothetical protein
MHEYMKILNCVYSKSNVYGLHTMFIVQLFLESPYQIRLKQEHDLVPVKHLC